MLDRVVNSTEYGAYAYAMLSMRHPNSGDKDSTVSGNLLASAEVDASSVGDDAYAFGYVAVDVSASNSHSANLTIGGDVSAYGDVDAGNVGGQAYA